MGFNIWMLLLGGFDLGLGVARLLHAPSDWFGWFLVGFGAALAILNWVALYQRREALEREALRRTVHLISVYRIPKKREDGQ